MKRKEELKKQPRDQHQRKKKKSNNNGIQFILHANDRAYPFYLHLDVGFEPIDAGGLASARYLEPMTMLWITMSRSMGRQFAFKVLR